ncbi:GRASP55/65 PDZ-like domain-containing protein [Pisolithus thermaeus]|nr:GRASP55/65 PDZ-like domain-containing protein [Pisolithus croceorrhizus]KAI6166604.1 GRASP55/65 PDZ-like domain-containing protein [Pisolithus thermaeus]
MGAGQSTNAQLSATYSLHVLRVTPGSPASQTSIEPFFDFIVGFNGKDSFSGDTDLDTAELERIVEEHEDKMLDLLVWSGKTRETRVVPIIPSRGWALAQQAALPPDDSGVQPQPSLLGLSMRMCEFESAMDNVWHVLEVLEGSPAESAGLVPYGDWIIGWSGGVLTAENDFYDVVEAHIDKPLRVYVYSYDFDNLREVVLVPNRHWGGEGLLGCVFGFGYLHRIPSQPASHNGGRNIPGSQMESGLADRDVTVPAGIPRSPPARAPRSSLDHPQHLVVAHPRPTRPHGATSQGAARRSTVTPGSSSGTPVGRSSVPLNGNGMRNSSPLSLDRGTVSTIATSAAYHAIAAKGARSLTKVASGPGRKDVYTADHGSGGDDSDGRNEDEDGTGSVSGTEGTDFGSLTSVE